LVSDNDVLVYVNNQKLILGADYIVEPYTGNDTRYVDFTIAPPVASEVLISVTTRADYVIYDDGSSTDNYQLVFFTSGGFYPQYGDVVSVTSWNNTAQQSIVTLLWQGPVTQGAVVVDDFQLGRIITDPTRMWVTKNGDRIFYGDDYLISGEQLIVHGGPIASNTVRYVRILSDAAAVTKSSRFEKKVLLLRAQAVQCNGTRTTFAVAAAA
jgi:hypothetical protein